MSRPYSEEEVREKFLEAVRSLVDYWDKEPRPKSQRERLSGLAFSILVILDGDSASLPGFTVSPHPHPDDREFHEKNGENWYQEGIDIAGSLHEEFYGNKEESEEA